MYEWIIEADLVRYQRQLEEARDEYERHELERLIEKARRRLPFLPSEEPRQ